MNLANAEILIVDDIPENLNVLRKTLEAEDYNILAATSGEMGLQIAKRNIPDLILLDIIMPKGIDGFETCRRLKQDESTANIPVIFITAKEETESVIEGFSVGGVDYITKPFRGREVLIRVETHLKNARLTQELTEKNTQLTLANEKLIQEIARREQAEDALRVADNQLSVISEHEAQRWGIKGFIGQSQTIQGILDDVRRLHRTERTNVLITGESGTGKELIARAIHFGGPRAKAPFIPFNCPAIPAELMESLFFGHVQGAFTGANRDQKGYFEQADGGTLFLDEIGDMPQNLQAKLLRVLEDGVVRPVGSTRDIHVDVRVLSATNADLQEKIATGVFRRDLYHRLATFTVDLPPLRERPDDIPLLVSHFLDTLTSEMGMERPELSQETLSALSDYHYPGNIRELKNIIEHALIKSGGSVIRPEHLHFIETSDFASQTDPTTSSKAKLVRQPEPVESDEISPSEAEVLLIRRSQRQTKGQLNDTASQDKAKTPSTDEERILAYVKERGSINNAECRDLLSTDLQCASYLLKKMQRYGVLKREGTRRWAYYRLA